MTGGGQEGHFLKVKERVPALFSQLPDALVTYVTGKIWGEAESKQWVAPGAPDDDILQHSRELLAQLTSAYLCGQYLGDLDLSHAPSIPELSFAICTVLSTPALIKAKGKEEPGRAQVAALHSAAPPSGKKATLPPWVWEYLLGKSGQHETRLVEEIKEGAKKLATNKGGVLVSRDIDFGIQHAAPKSSGAVYNEYGLAVSVDVPRYFRVVTITNQSLSEVVLLSVRALPEMEDKLLLHDDLKVAHNYLGMRSEQDQKEGLVGVSMGPKAEYQVAVELRCIPQDAAHLHQWLLFTFAPASALNPTPKEQTSAKPPNPADRVFIIGRRISALIAKSVADMDAILSVEAIPFYPASLRTLFDTPPKFFLVGKKPALLTSSRLFELLERTSPPPAYKQVGALCYEPESLFTPGATADVALWQPSSANTSNKAQPKPTVNVPNKLEVHSPKELRLAQHEGSPPTLDQPGAAILDHLQASSLAPQNPHFHQILGGPFFGGPFQGRPTPPQPINFFAAPLVNQHLSTPPSLPMNQPSLSRPHTSPPNMPNWTAPNPLLQPAFQQPTNVQVPNPFTPRFPHPVLPPQVGPITATEVQQLSFWLNAQIARVLETSRFVDAQQALQTQAWLRQGAEVYFQNYMTERHHLAGLHGPFPPAPAHSHPPWGAPPAPVQGLFPNSVNVPPVSVNLPPGPPLMEQAPIPGLVKTQNEAPGGVPVPRLQIPEHERSSSDPRLDLPSDLLSPIHTTSNGGEKPASKRAKKPGRGSSETVEGASPTESVRTPAGSQGEASHVTALCECSRQQLRQLSRLLALEETAMEKDIKAHDLYNTRLQLQATTAPGDVHLFALEVPGLPENRPSVLYADVVYLRLVSAPQVEYAAFTWAVEMRPSPRVLLALSEDFVTAAKLSRTLKRAPEEGSPGWARALAQEPVHARFTFDRLLMKRMHVALAKAALAPFALLPCICERETSNQRSRGPLSQAQPSSHRPSADPMAKHNPMEWTSRIDWADSFALINKKLNQQQRQAVGSLLAERFGRGPYVVFGPPGTGKTVTMVEMCLQLLQRPALRLCVCAPSNFAADILCSGIAAGGVGPDVMWRLNDPRRTLASVKSDVIRFCKHDAATGLFDVHPNPSAFRVILCTCGAAALLQEPPLVEHAGAFTHVLIDEAGQALLPETLIAFGLANEHSKLVLCGDPRQLGPVVHSQVAAEHGLAQSLLESYMKGAEARVSSTPSKPSQTPPEPFDILERLLPKEGPSPANPLHSANGKHAHSLTGAHSHQPSIVKLLHNYRSHRKLLELPSRMFYRDELVATAEAASVEPPRDWEEMQGSEFPMLFYGVKGQQMREGEAPSYFNPLEAERLVNLLQGLLHRVPITTGDVGVMAPYRKQVQKLRLLLRDRGLGAVRVGTVDDYQGQEERVIFISTVLTKPESLRRGAKHGPDGSIGFLGNAKRFNVAITRAKALLVVVGHPLVLLEDENWRQLLKYCLARDAY